MVLVVALTLLGCAGGVSTDGTASPSDPDVRCVMFLHGKGGSGGETSTSEGVATIRPEGNGRGWGGRQWEYESNSDYREAVKIVSDAVDDERCGAVVLHGFSNGGAFAGKLYCSGESLGGRLRGVVVDDPVPDHGVEPCAPASDVEEALYWSGELASTAQAGTDCGRIDWTCAGGSMIGIEAYGRALGATVQQSASTRHEPHPSPPEVARWLAGAPEP